MTVTVTTVTRATTLATVTVTVTVTRALPHCGASKKFGFGEPERVEHLASCGLRSLGRDGLA